jgi:hypothetical protein
MSISNVNIPLVGLFLGSLVVFSGHLLHSGCPTQKAESDQGLLRCAAMGGYNLCADYLAPDAKKVEDFGLKTLESFGSNITSLDEQFKHKFPNGIEYLVEKPKDGACLSPNGARVFYNTVVSKISNLVSSSADTDCIQKAHTASKLRSDARKVTRAISCNHADDDFLEARDACTYGTKRPGFLYFVGKYAKQAIEKCKNKVCDIKQITCDAVIKGALRTNAAVNAIFS